MELIETRVRGVLAASPAVRASVVVRRAGCADLVSIAPDAVFHAASTMKVPVLVELYRRVAAGALALGDTLPVTTCFRSLADGSPYVLSPASDTELGLYDRVGELVTLRELAALMITVSSNVAANMLVELLGAPAVSAGMADLGAPSLRVLRGVEDLRGFDAGLNNTVTARGLATLFEELALGRILSPAASEEMLSVLAGQAFNHAIPAGLPAGLRVAHKTGSITGLFHDAGVVLDGPGAPWVIVALTQGLPGDDAAPAVIAAVAHQVYEAICAASA